MFRKALVFSFLLVSTSLLVCLFYYDPRNLVSVGLFKGLYYILPDTHSFLEFYSPTRRDVSGGYVPSEVEKIVNVENKRLTSLQVFGKNDRSIEPSEILERQTLIALPWVSKIGYHLEFNVLADSGYRWRATTIVDRSEFEDNDKG